MTEENCSDDDLPQISVNRTARGSDDFIMPSADVLASQRAREEECEEELRQLRSQYETQELVRLVSTDSSSSESEGSLTAAVDALSVATPTLDQPPTAADIVSMLATNLASYDTEFLSTYLAILMTNDEDVIYTATNDIVESIECILLDVLEGGAARSEGEVVVVGSWLSAATVWHSPRVPAARRLLHALLDTATTQQGERVANAVCEALGWAGAGVEAAQALVRAADAAAAREPGAGPARRRLAARLRAAALDRLAPDRAHTDMGSPDELTVQRVCGRLCSAWRELSAGAKLTALQLVGRADWPRGSASGPGDVGDSAGVGGVGDSGGAGGGGDPRGQQARAAARDLLALMAQPPPTQHRHSPDYLKVLVGASKLQILFRVNA